jgi:hypothetical protein
MEGDALMARHVRIEEVSLGVEGTALLRHLLDGSDDFVARRTGLFTNGSPSTDPEFRKKALVRRRIGTQSEGAPRLRRGELHAGSSVTACGCATTPAPGSASTPDNGHHEPERGATPTADAWLTSCGTTALRQKP